MEGVGCCDSFVECIGLPLLLSKMIVHPGKFFFLGPFVEHLIMSRGMCVKPISEPPYDEVHGAAQLGKSIYRVRARRSSKRFCAPKDYAREVVSTERWPKQKQRSVHAHRLAIARTHRQLDNLSRSCEWSHS